MDGLEEANCAGDGHPSARTIVAAECSADDGYFAAIARLLGRFLGEDRMSPQ